MKPTSKKISTHGFTIIELCVIIVVIGILASIIIISVGAWRTRTAETEVKSDLLNASSAMEAARNFNSGYPTSLPTGFTASPNVAVTYGSGDAKGYCIDGVSKVISSVHYFVNASSVATDPIKGTCATGADQPSGSGDLVAWKSLDAAGGSVCGISFRDTVYCWGVPWSIAGAIPTLNANTGPLAGATISKVTVGYEHACALTSASLAYCWGTDDNGQLGDGTNTNSATPVAVSMSGVLSGKTIKDISAGFDTTCAIASDSNTYCWGVGTYGQLGNNSTTSSSVPVAVDTSGVLSGKTVKSVQASIGPFTNTSSVCVIASDNLPYCWGYNNSGELGNSLTTQSSVPVAVKTNGALSGKTVQSITLGSGHACVLASDTKVYCWGSSTYGALGTGNTAFTGAPAAVDTSGVLAGKTVKSVDAGGYNTCVVTTDNGLYCTGYSTQLGNGSASNSLVMVAVTTSGVLSGKTVQSVVLGGYANNAHVCATTTERQAYCWGVTKLGNNTSVSSNVPVAVSPVYYP